MQSEKLKNVWNIFELFSMSLQDQISIELKSAMKSGDAMRVSVLRMAVAAFKNKEFEVRRALSDAEAQDIITKEAKKRTEAIALFVTGGREDLASNERKELALLQAYLPTMMSESEIRAQITTLVAQATSKEFGLLMKQAMQELRGKADGALVGKILKEMLL